MINEKYWILLSELNLSHAVKDKAPVEKKKKKIVCDHVIKTGSEVHTQKGT